MTRLQVAIALSGTICFAQDAAPVRLHRIGRTIARQAAPVAAATPVVDFSVRLVPNDPSDNALFGSNVSIQGNLAVVGANSADRGLGAAYVFERKSGGWTQTAKLVAHDRFAGSEFGENVVISGKTIAIGAPSDRSGTGAVYVYQNVSGAWVEEAKVVAADGEQFEFFADSIALQGDLLLVGADLGSAPGIPGAGAAYAFRHNANAGTWIQEAKLSDANPRPGGGYGAGTAIADGDTIAIGNTEAAIFYRHTGSTWSPQSRVVAQAPGELFGVNIAIDRNFMIVGAPFALASSGVNTGAAYLYRRAGDNWTLESRIEPTDPISRFFGTRVGISGSIAVAGAPFTDFNQAPAGASAWVARRSGNSWTIAARLRPHDSTPLDNFGGYAAIDGSTILIGAEEALAASGIPQGAAYLFLLDK
ncbi:MAG: hypothetical protein U0Q16_32365 [Bryobacteraceae bacterium]